MDADNLLSSFKKIIPADKMLDERKIQPTYEEVMVAIQAATTLLAQANPKK